MGRINPVLSSPPPTPLWFAEDLGAAGCHSNVLGLLGRTGRCTAWPVTLRGCCLREMPVRSAVRKQSPARSRLQWRSGGGRGVSVFLFHPQSLCSRRQGLGTCCFGAL